MIHLLDVIIEQLCHMFLCCLHAYIYLLHWGALWLQSIPIPLRPHRLLDSSESERPSSPEHLQAYIFRRHSSAAHRMRKAFSLALLGGSSNAVASLNKSGATPMRSTYPRCTSLHDQTPSPHHDFYDGLRPVCSLICVCRAGCA